MGLRAEDKSRTGLLRGGACLGEHRALGSACAFAQEVSLAGLRRAGVPPGSCSCSLSRDGEPGCGGHGTFLEEPGLQQHISLTREAGHTACPRGTCVPSEQHCCSAGGH